MAQKKMDTKTALRSRSKSGSSGRKTQKRGSSSKWINSPKDHEDHKGQSLATRSHNIIMKWAEDRKRQPTVVPGTGRKNSAGILRIDFPGFAELQPTAWDEWFKTFDDRQLTFLFQEQKRNGDLSTFFKLQSSEGQRKAA